METIQSGGKTIRIHVSEPEMEGEFPAVLLLHGAGGNVYFWLDHIAPAIAQLGIAVYAVHYFDSTGTAYATPAIIGDTVSVPAWLQVVRDTLAWIAARPAVDARRIGLVGVSLGAFIALALGTEEAPGGVRIKTIVDVSGGLAPPWDGLATAAFPPTLILHGEIDPMVPPSNARTLDAILTRIGVRHEMHMFAHEGHWFSAAAQVEILRLIAGFLDKHL